MSVCLPRRQICFQTNRAGERNIVAERSLYSFRSFIQISLAAYSSMPAMEADIMLAIVPASMARRPSRASSPFLLGANAPMPPI
jgi:hypothetical protein